MRVKEAASEEQIMGFVRVQKNEGCKTKQTKKKTREVWPGEQGPTASSSRDALCAPSRLDTVDVVQRRAVLRAEVAAVQHLLA